jgi:cell wall-associated NlpC family hydrolase
VPTVRPHASRAPSWLAALTFAVAATLASAALAGERPADRSLAEAARASLLAAASRMVEGTRDVTLFALSLVGIDYRYGGATPAHGLDCSGLIHYVFQEATGVVLPRTSRELSRIGKSIRAGDLEPGDLVFFNTRHAAFSHVGIYLGDDRFIHAPSRGGEVNVATLSARYWQQRYSGARRLFGVLPALLPDVITRAEARSSVQAAAASAVPVPPQDDQPQGPAAEALDIQP